MKTKRSFIAIIFLALGISSVSCQNKAQSTQTKEEATARDSLQLVDYSIHFVELPFEYAITDSLGKKKHYVEAWLVKMQWKNMSAYPAQKVDFFIGDYRITEYGGWEKGIYFRIYDKQLLDKLNAKEISYLLPGHHNPISTKRKLEVDLSKKKEKENENKVLGRKVD